MPFFTSSDKALWLLALPMIFSNITVPLLGLVDTAVIGHLESPVYLGGVAVGATATSFLFMLLLFLRMSTTGLTAQAFGAKDPQALARALVQPLLLALGAGAAIALFRTPIIDLALHIVGGSEAVLEQARRFLEIRWLSAPASLANLVLLGWLLGVQYARAPVILLIVGNILNIVLDLWPVMGLHMNVQGAALATGLGQVFTLIIYFIVYFGRPINVKFGIKHLHEGGLMVKKLYAIGIPAILNMALPSLLTSALNAILSMYSATYVMILGVYYKLQTFLYMPANGIIQGMRPIIGYNYGAGEHARVKKIFTITLALNVGIMLAGTVVCLLIPERLIGMFTENMSTINAGGTALRIICAGFVVSAVSVTASGALEGLGKGTPSLLISLLRYVVVIIPAAWILSKLCGFGPAGVWNAFWVAELITAACAAFIYRGAMR